jgi:hypothetical protein
MTLESVIPICVAVIGFLLSVISIVVFVLSGRINALQEEAESTKIHLNYALQRANFRSQIDQEFEDYILDEKYFNFRESLYFENYLRPETFVEYLENAGFVRDETRVVSARKQMVLCAYCANSFGDGSRCQHCGGLPATDYRIYGEE